MSRKGLEAHDGCFFINSQKTRLFSGTLHYFRIPSEYWEDRLTKLRACGCNAVETYVAWNLHEKQRGQFDFEGMLDLSAYIKLAQKCGLFVILRPGPYICAEWEYGGLPSWLLTDLNLKVRSTYTPYMDAVSSFFSELFSRIHDQLYTNGGPIIAVQIENEYGSYGSDRTYLQDLKELMTSLGVQELFFTSDNDVGIFNGNLEGVLMTVNFNRIVLGVPLLAALIEKQPSMPRMVMEYWTGWFDHWGDKSHATTSLQEFETVLAFILQEFGNVNFYMFQGGTNFGFMNGSNDQLFNMPYQADVTSYDYDAPISEEGKLTPKYYKAKEMLQPHLGDLVYLGDCPPLPEPIPAKAYGSLSIQSSLPFEQVLAQADNCELPESPVSMELLPVNGGLGQSLGWTCYRKTLVSEGEVLLSGKVRDRAQVYLDGSLIAQFDVNSSDNKFTLAKGGVLSILVENLGRTNYCPPHSDILNSQRKGLTNPISLDGSQLLGWTAYCLDFSKEMVTRLLATLSSGVPDDLVAPAVLQATLVVDGDPCDTFLDMTGGFGKGIVLINGRNIGRYWPTVGPQKTLFVPGPWLKTGENQVLIFEVESIGTTLTFTDVPNLG